MSPVGQDLVGRTLVGIDGGKIGRIDAIYVNSSTGEPEWVAINLGGLLASKHGFAPVANVTAEGDKAVVAFEKNHVKHAPTTKSEGVLSPQENDALYRYYSIEHDSQVQAGSRDSSLWAGRS
jgi:PRC-barrel domain protein